MREKTIDFYNQKTIKKTTPYKNVLELQDKVSGRTTFVVAKKGVARIPYTTAKEAAIAVDKWLISKGKDPINVLKKIM